MSFVAIGLVLLSGFVHAIWNLFAKKSMNKHVFLWLCYATSVLVFSPYLWTEGTSLTHVHSSEWLVIAASVGLHGAYIYMLAVTYEIGDLSQVYPIMRGTSPLLVPFIGVLVLGEQLRLLGWFGVACIVFGIYIAGNLRLSGLWHRRNRAIWLALCVGVLITTYTVVDKVAIRSVPPQLLTELTNIGNFLTLSLIVMRQQGIKKEWRMNWRTIVLGGVLSPGGYILFLKAMALSPVSQLAPMREIGTVFGTVMGVFLLHEPQGRKRLWASVLITAGVVLLAQ
ncbi:EamA family transporter [Cohnella yongneupensis]|uniref:EamA family transporter n=1 Tax=Cohnella yongneupensis TaxID=425006 RepID=A0ABW0QVZ2_9BACL